MSDSQICICYQICASIGVIFQYRWYRYCYLTSGSWILTNGSWIQICIGTFLYSFLTEANKEKGAWSHLEMVTLHSLSRRAAPSSKILPALCLQHIHAECSSAFTNQFCKRIAVKLTKFLFFVKCSQISVWGDVGLFAAVSVLWHLSVSAAEKLKIVNLCFIMKKTSLMSLSFPAFSRALIYLATQKNPVSHLTVSTSRTMFSSSYPPTPPTGDSWGFVSTLASNHLIMNP